MKKIFSVLDKVIPILGISGGLLATLTGIQSLNINEEIATAWFSLGGAIGILSIGVILINKSE